jgi:[acyl-carrier-protein] S-malonyltransferase
VDLLKQIFKTKLLPVIEQEERFNKLFKEAGLQSNTVVYKENKYWC